MDAVSDRIITATVNEFCRMAGIGRTLLYQLIGTGDLDTITIGKRRLIVLDSYRRLIERQRAQGRATSVKTPKRMTRS